jgi:hypothetical protein
MWTALQTSRDKWSQGEGDLDSLGTRFNTIRRCLRADLTLTEKDEIGSLQCGEAGNRLTSPGIMLPRVTKEKVRMYPFARVHETVFYGISELYRSRLDSSKRLHPPNYSKAVTIIKNIGNGQL